MGVSVNELACALIDELGLDPVAAAGGDKLHKLLYYVQGHHAAATGEPLFAEPIEAADDGPVVVGFVRADVDAPRGELDGAVLGTLRYVAFRYGRLSVVDLRNLTKAEPPWQAGRQLPGRRLALDDMIAYFRGDGAAAPPPLEVSAAGQGVTRRRSWMVVGVVYSVVIGLAGLVVLGGVAVKNALDGGGAAEHAVVGRAGEPARDGDFEFTVTALDCGRSVVGDGMFAGAAKGPFCLVTLVVKNVGARARPFDESSQRAYDEKGAQYFHDADAEFRANFGAHAWFQRIDPGGQVSGKLVFDVPSSSRLTAVELHDSPGSGGVRVSLK